MPSFRGLGFSLTTPSGEALSTVKDNPPHNRANYVSHFVEAEPGAEFALALAVDLDFDFGVHDALRFHIRCDGKLLALQNLRKSDLQKQADRTQPFRHVFTHHPGDDDDPDDSPFRFPDSFDVTATQKQRSVIVIAKLGRMNGKREFVLDTQAPFVASFKFNCKTKEQFQLLKNPQQSQQTEDAAKSSRTTGSRRLTDGGATTSRTVPDQNGPHLNEGNEVPIKQEPNTQPLSRNADRIDTSEQRRLAAEKAYNALDRLQQEFAPMVDGTREKLRRQFEKRELIKDTKKVLKPYAQKHRAVQQPQPEQQRRPSKYAGKFYIDLTGDSTDEDD